MFGRFTDEARRVLALAQEEATGLHHGRIGTEHILLGLAHESDGIAAEALQALGISPEAVREQVCAMGGHGQEAPAAGHSQYTLRAKKALDASLREALRLGHHHVGTEHILLGLLRVGDGPAAQVLAELGADLIRVREQVIYLLGQAEDGGWHEAGGGARGHAEDGGWHQAEGGARGHAEDGRWHQAEGGERHQAGCAGAVQTGAPEVTAASQPADRHDGVSAESRMLAEVLSRIETMDSRLSAVEQQLGVGPDVRDLDQQIAQARRDKESAAAAEDYENAAAQRDRERQLLADKTARQSDWSAAHLDLPSLAEGLHMLSDEVGRLRGLLSQQGNSSRDGAA
jgi:ATP-dependent Clp protease ATP-binding subunit ClpA